MIDKFNFYDLYGYLIPGLVLLIIAGAPFVIIGQTMPANLDRVSLLIVAIVIAYIAGYFIHSMATNAIPSMIDGEYPSSTMLNPESRIFTTRVREKIAEKAKAMFDLSVEVGRTADQHLTNIRQNAFFSARAVATAKKSGAYFEQHQGLYSMMRGLSVMFLFGVYYTLGWALSFWHGKEVLAYAGLGLLLGALVVFAIARARQKADGDPKKKKDVDLAALVCYGVLFLPAGYIAGVSLVFDGRTDMLFWFISILYITAAIRFYISYKAFSVEFAKAVWLAFFTLDTNTDGQAAVDGRRVRSPGVDMESGDGLG